MPVDESRVLAQLLPHLASLLSEVPLGAPVAIGVALPAACDYAAEMGAPPVEFFFRHLDCIDVVCALGGFVAPAGWDAFGIVAPGHRMMLDPPADDPGNDPADDLADDAVTVCALLGRGGLVVSEVRTVDGTVVSSGATTGRAVDACRRVLGLATAPPLLGPHVWRTLRWIDRVLATVLDADLGRPPSWPALSALYALDSPALRFTRPACAAQTEPPEWSWYELRNACAGDQLTVPCIDSETAAWMDDGLFAREAIAAFPLLVESLGDLRQLLPPSTFDMVVAWVSDQLAA